MEFYVSSEVSVAGRCLKGRSKTNIIPALFWPNILIRPRERVTSLQDFAAAVANALEIRGEDFEAKQPIVEELDLQATLGVETRCVVGDTLCVSDTVPQICRERKKKV